MARFLIRSVISTIITMLLVSMALFAMLEVGGRDVATRILGIESTPEQRASLRLQLGLDQSAFTRYSSWLLGNDWWVSNRIDGRLRVVENLESGEDEWWVEVDGQLTRWRMREGEMFALVRQADGSADEILVENDLNWQVDEDGEYFWGVNNNNSAVRWNRGAGETVYSTSFAGSRAEGDGPVQYIPLRKGMMRGDPGESLQSGRPISVTLSSRIRNTFVLAGLAFVLIMPVALILGIIAGINEGRITDRIISIGGLALTATPEYVSGILLILIFAVTLPRYFPGLQIPATFLAISDTAIFDNPKQLILPILTLTAAELGYIARMTRASMVEVMDSAYIRTAIIKGMPYRRVVIRHAIRNALMAPITIMMLHVNYLVGGLVVVEVIFGIPGLGKYIYDSAVFGDVNAIEAAAMVTVLIAVATRLIGDLAYTFLNPRIRYA